MMSENAKEPAKSAKQEVPSSENSSTIPRIKESAAAAC